MSDKLIKGSIFLKKIEDVVREDQYGFRRERTRDASGMLRIISEQTWDIDEKLCACLADRQKAPDHVNWTELMHILTFKRRIKSHLPFSGIIRSSPYSPRFQDKG